MQNLLGHTSTIKQCHALSEHFILKAFWCISEPISIQLYYCYVLSIHFKLVWIHRHTNPIELFIHLTSNKVVKSSRSRMSSIVFLKIKMFWVLFVKSVLWRYFSFFKAKTLISLDWPLDWSLMVIKMFALKFCRERLRDEKRFDSGFHFNKCWESKR